jgi:hypothetical protein
MKQISIKQLIDHVLDAMLDFKLNKSTLKSYKYSYFAPIKKFFFKNGKLLYSKETTVAFLKNSKERLSNNEISECYYRMLRKAADLLEEYNITGSLKWKTRNNRTKIKLNGYFTSLLLAYE